MKRRTAQLERRGAGAKKNDTNKERKHAIARAYSADKRRAIPTSNRTIGTGQKSSSQLSMRKTANSQVPPHSGTENLTAISRNASYIMNHELGDITGKYLHERDTRKRKEKNASEDQTNENPKTTAEIHVHTPISPLRSQYA